MERKSLELLAAACLTRSSVKSFAALTLPEQLELLRSPEFPEQNRFIVDKAQFLAALCTRRAGKSNGLAYRFYRTMLKHSGSQCRYIALTRDSAKDIMWGVLQEIDEKHQVGAKFTESNLTVTMPDKLGGSSLRLFGADMKNFIKRLKGVKSPGVGIDEAQDFGAHIESLIDDVLTPTISDYPDGWLAVTGTPGPIPMGMFYDITEKARDGYSLHKWSLYQNPHFPDPYGFVARLKAKKQWSDQNPTYLREWQGQWVLDLDALVYRYNPTLNHYAHLPELSGKWEYVIGVDIGHDDADAIAVIGWNVHQKHAYLIEEHIHAGQGITELAEQISAAIKKYSPIKVVMDTGGLGKKIAVEIQRRYALQVEAADKDRKYEYIEILNDALRMGRLFARSDSRFAQDSARVKWDQDSLKPKISDSFHSDICDAVLYAYRESLHWLAEPAIDMPKAGTEAWKAKQEEEMEQAAAASVTRNKEDEVFGDIQWQNVGF